MLTEETVHLDDPEVKAQAEALEALRRKLRAESFELTLIPRLSWVNLKSEFLKTVYGIDSDAEMLGKIMPLVGHEITRRYVRVSAGDIGLQGSNPRFDIYRMAFRIGLQECHPQAGWELMLANRVLRLPIRDLLIGSAPIEVGTNYPLLFEIRDGQTMNVDAGGVPIQFTEERQWLFEVA